MEQKEKKRKAGLNLNQRVWNKEKQDKAAYRLWKSYKSYKLTNLHEQYD